MLGDFFPQPTDEPPGSDAAFMRSALAEARRAMGRVAPNPAVGAIIVRDGKIVGRGATQPPTGDHAEIVALKAAGNQAAGADLYVTLEPCCHLGRTPPCTDAIIAAGIRRVVIGTVDPNPEVHLGGIKQLEQAGIEVRVGVLEREASNAIAGFRSRISSGRPHVLVKYAMTLDGKIATRTGHSRWISGPEARVLTHVMRDRIDAIMVGSNTVVVDNPRLTTRLDDKISGSGGPHHPRRIVIDGRLRTPPDADILAPGSGDEPLIYCTEDAPADAERRLVDAGAIVRRIPATNNHVDLRPVFEDLGRLGLNQLLVEGGGGLIGACLDVGLVDEIITFIAPVIVGGDGPPPVAGYGVETMPDAWQLDDIRMHNAGRQHHAPRPGRPAS
ncbi:MAG: bifunctional diaminohydroxyphosphoribosylaminopyrimidine deaminase/5-amino-6-(5-phosphoribosylamino)uracil reductase RibD [Thermomicrobiales bacterium]